MLAIAKQSTWFLGLWYWPGFVFGAMVMIFWFIVVIWLIRKTSMTIKPALFLVIASILLVGYYIITSIDIRYVLPVILLGLLGTAFVFSKAYSKSASKYLLRTAFIVLILFLMINMGVSSVLASQTGQLNGEWNPLQYTMYNEGIKWMTENTTPDTIIGSFNSGIYGYFSGRKVVNLDGVINNNAYYAIRDKRLYAYIDEQNISYIIDWDYIESYYLDRFGGDENLTNHLERVATITKSDEPHKGLQLVVYKVKK